MSAPPAEPTSARRPGYQIAGPQTWALARELYLAGLPAPEVAARLDVSVHNLRKKASREGWSRRAHAERVLDARLAAAAGEAPGAAAGEGGLDGAPDDAPAEADPGEAAKTLVRRAAALALAGRAEAASALLKTAEALRRAAEVAAPAPPDGWEAPAAADLPRTPEDEAELGFRLARMARRLSEARGAPAEVVEAQAAAAELKYAAWAALVAARDPSARPPPR